MIIGANPGGGLGGSSAPWIRRWPIDEIQKLGLSPPSNPEIVLRFRKVRRPVYDNTVHPR